MAHTIADREAGYAYTVRSAVTLLREDGRGPLARSAARRGIAETLEALRNRGAVTAARQVFNDRYRALASEHSERERAEIRPRGIDGEAEQGRPLGRREPAAQPPELWVVELAEGAEPKEVAEELADDAELFEAAWVPSPRYPCADLSAPGGDPMRPSQWALDRIRLAEVRAHHRFVEPRDRRVTIVDTGMEGDHPDLAGIDYDNLVQGESDRDYHGHGTAVAGVIGAVRGNAEGIEGICEADTRMLKAFPWTRIAPWDAAAFYRALGIAAETPSHLVNLSFAGTAWDDGETILVDRLLDAGVIVVAAMGNEGETGNPTLYPAALAEGRDVIAVAAVDDQDRPCAFSSRGPHATVAAPGSSIRTCVPRTANYYSQSANGYDYLEGTSFAAAIVSASLAIARAAGVVDGPGSAKRLLERTAVPTAGQAVGEHLETVGFGVIDVLALLDD